jgi:hypothetical protein
MVEQCPLTSDLDGPGFTRFTTVRNVEREGTRTLLVQVQPCDERGGCTPHFRSYLLLAQHADGVTQASFTWAEDGDPVDEAGRLLDALADQLARAAS